MKAKENQQYYGYFTPFNADQMVHMKPGQNISGCPIGILYIEDVWYPMVPGNIVNGYTFDFPVRLKAVKGLTCEKLFTMEESVEQAVLEAARELEREGVRAISGACGFFGNYQSFLAEKIDIPVAVSSLVQIPWIQTLLKSDQKVLVLTADKSSFSKKLLESCGVFEQQEKRIVVKDLGQKENFSCILEGRGTFDNKKVMEEVVGEAKAAIAENDEIGAILLECSDMPPYAFAVQQATKLPVFDFTTLIRWLYNACVQKPYYGFI